MVDNILILILIMIDELTNWNIKRNERYTHCVAKNTVYYHVQRGIIVTRNSGGGELVNNDDDDDDEEEEEEEGEMVWNLLSIMILFI